MADKSPKKKKGRRRRHRYGLFNGNRRPKLTATVLIILRRRSRRTSFDVTERNAALRQIIGREFQRHFVAGENADVMLAHLAVRVSNELMAVFKLHTVTGVGQDSRSATSLCESA